jgi:dUTP pyrophosphatase
MKVKIKKIKPDATLPSYAYPGDAGLDMCSLEDYELKPGERRIFDCGFALEFPKGYVAIVKDKGSLPRKFGCHTMAGVFDAGYRGEYNVLLINLSQETHKIKKGDKLAQLVILPLVQAELEEVKELSESERGQAAWGSSGR